MPLASSLVKQRLGFCVHRRYNVYLMRDPKPVLLPAPFDYGPAAGSLIPGPGGKPTAATAAAVAAAAVVAASQEPSVSVKAQAGPGPAANGSASDARPPSTLDLMDNIFKV